MGNLLIVMSSLTTQTARGSAVNLLIVMSSLTTQTARGSAVKLIVMNSPTTQTARGSAVKWIARTLSMILAVESVGKLVKTARRTLILPNVKNACNNKMIFI